MDVIAYSCPDLIEIMTVNGPAGCISYDTTHTASLQSKFVVKLHSSSQFFGSADQSQDFVKSHGLYRIGFGDRSTLVEVI